MNEIHLPKTKVAELHAICAERNNDPGELINILHAAQGLFGYLPPEVQQVIAAELNIPVSRVYGVVTFYSFFTMTPKGKYPISVCLGTACYVRGAENVLEEMQRQLEIKVGETTLCRCLRISSGGHDRREGLWKGYSREGTGYTFRLLSERAIRYENTSGHIRFYVTACIK